VTRIRVATNLDREDIGEVHLRAFPESERQMVSSLAIDLLSEETSPETLSLVAESDGQVVGHIAFSPVTADKHGEWVGYILAPLGVIPGHQKRRIGSQLIESGMERLAEKSADVLFVYGDPKYYGRFGFTVDVARAYTPPYDLKYPFGWQAMVLNGTGPMQSNARISCVAALRDPGLW